MIHLLRHGETEFNVERRFQGALDSALTARGAEQARAYARVLRDLVPRDCRIVSSPQGRALRTAELFAEAGGFTATIVTDGRLREITLGAWDGRLRSEFAAENPGWTADRPIDFFAMDAGGESYESMVERLSDWLDEAATWEGPTIAVSHGVSCRILRGLYAGLEREALLALDVPQDAVFRFVDGVVQRFDCKGEE
jgi:broad specificity phosphatase PhoE